MIFDFRAADCPTEVTCDICVIGAGAAGISMAHTFAHSQISLCLVESGGLEADLATQELSAGQSVGLPWGWELASARRRMFGGTTSEWGGGCVALDPTDMQAREWVPHSGWPITRESLDPFYERARSVFRLADQSAVEQAVRHNRKLHPLRFDPALLVHVRSLHSGNLHFGEAFRAEVARSKNVMVLLNASLLELKTDTNGATVQRAHLRCLTGRTGWVAARYFVLACGGIENARLLLLSNSVKEHGLGNDRDLVGRFFMDHPSATLGSIVPKQPDHVSPPYDRRLERRRQRHSAQIGLSWALQQKQRVLNGRLRPDVIEEDVPAGISALRGLRRDLAKFAACRVPRQALRVMADAGAVAPAVCRVLRGRPAVNSYRIVLNGFFEQAPNPDSRVRLGDELDVFGQRKVRLDWQLTELDRRTYETAARAFHAELARLGLGSMRTDDWLAPTGPKFGGVVGTAHHMGTTRMSSDPRTGVVDPDCRVHGMNNLFIAGSSVFPTGGWAFPTFTIVALALRLCDLLRKCLEQPVAHAPEDSAPVRRLLMTSRSASRA